MITKISIDEPAVHAAEPSIIGQLLVQQILDPMCMHARL
jgi:hypothetical protein